MGDTKQKLHTAKWYVLSEMKCFQKQNTQTIKKLFFILEFIDFLY
jgi:hypothetical protein